jgi:hypothetical protein
MGVEAVKAVIKTVLVVLYRRRGSPSANIYILTR